MCQGLLNFLLDDPFALDILMMELPVALQGAIIAEIEKGTAQRFLSAAYSTLSYPFSTRYQNSNHWLLEVLAAAQARLAGFHVRDRGEAQAYYKRAKCNGAARSGSYTEAMESI